MKGAARVLDEKSIMNQILKEEAFFVNQKQGDIHSFILDDDRDQLLEKLINIHRLNSIDRENYTKHISYCIKYLGQKGIDKLPVIFDRFKQDDERFQIMFLEQLNLIYEIIPQDQSKAQGFILQILSYFLLNSILKIKEIAGVQLSKIAVHLEGDDKGNQLLPIIIKMAHDDVNEENRVVALQLMGKLCKIFGVQLCESFIAFEILSLGEDAKFLVRREAVNQLPLVSKLVGNDFFNKKLFPFYLKQCKETNTKVKNACADHFLQITELASPQQRTQELTAQLLHFQTDSHKQIKGVAFRCLARFIAAIEPDKLEPKLFENYLRMVDSDIRDLLPEHQVMFACAYGFPAVLQTVGITKWPQLLKLFNQLWKQKNERICKTLAASLHEVAKQIGPIQAEKDLFPILENIYVKEPSDSILMVCVKNLSQFLKIFSDEKKESLMEIFFFVQKDQKKWRIRESIANQIDEMAKIFNPDTIFKIILPIAFKLCTDNVAQVRKAAAEKVYSLFDGIHGCEMEEQYKMCIIQSMIGFQKSQVYYQRQAFITMCSKMLNLDNDLFELHFKVPLLELAKDPVANVRFSVAKILIEHINSKGRLSKDEQLLSALVDLSNDQVILKLLKYQSTLQTENPIQVETINPSEEISNVPQLEEIDDSEIPERKPQNKQEQHQPQQQQQQQQQQVEQGQEQEKQQEQQKQQQQEEIQEDKQIILETNLQNTEETIGMNKSQDKPIEINEGIKEKQIQDEDDTHTKN